MGDHVDAYPVVVTATFVADELAAPFAFWSTALDLPHDLTVAPFGQVVQHLLDPSGPLVAGGAGADVVLVRPEDWARDLPGRAGGALGVTGRQAVDAAAADLAGAVRTAAARHAVPLLVALCPASPELLADPVDGPHLDAVAARLTATLAGLPGVAVIDAADLLAGHGVTRYADGYADRLAHTPYTRTFWTLLGTALVRHLHALRTPRPKVIVVDADHTLWDGVVGEDGVDGVAIGPDRRALHELLLGQRDAGVLLALSSRNDAADVTAVLRDRPEMRLREEHLTGLRADWRRKSEHLRELAAELDLGLDSFVFLDDSPVECAEVRAACPEVLTLQLPADAAKALAYLRHVWALDRPAVTAADRHRAEAYRVEQRRRRSRQDAGSLADFIAGLGLDARVAPATEGELDRLAQLTQRTNQFTTTTVRRTAAELAAVSRAGADDLLAVHVTDRFGDYGLVGCVLLGPDPGDTPDTTDARGTGDAAGTLRVDALLLSCRVLGRGVEHRVLAAIGEVAVRRGLSTVELAVVPGPRNSPAADFVTAVAGPPVSDTGGQRRHRLPAADAAALRYQPREPAPATAAQPAAPGGGQEQLAAPAPWRLLDRIARELATAGALDAAVHPDRARTGGAPSDAANATEVAVASLWADVLRVAPGSVTDSFFALGGQSLQVVQFMARIREVFGVELPIELLFTPTFTVAESAAHIDAAAGAAAADHIDLLLAEVEALTDDEVAALLAAEDA